VALHRPPLSRYGVDKVAGFQAPIRKPSVQTRAAVHPAVPQAWHNCARPIRNRTMNTTMGADHGDDDPGRYGGKFGTTWSLIYPSSVWIQTQCARNDMTRLG
jgi:hypothetical protein